MLRCVHACVLSDVCHFVTPWTVAHQASLSVGFFRQEYWSGFPPPGDIPNPGVNPTLVCLLHWQTDSLSLSHLASKVVSSVPCLLGIFYHQSVEFCHFLSCTDWDNFFLIHSVNVYYIDFHILYHFLDFKNNSHLVSVCDIFNMLFNWILVRIFISIFIK